EAWRRTRGASMAWSIGAPTISATRPPSHRTRSLTRNSSARPPRGSSPPSGWLAWRRPSSRRCTPGPTNIGATSSPAPCPSWGTSARGIERWCRHWRGPSPTRCCTSRRSRCARCPGEVDVAVHSLKDVPTAETGDLVIAAIPVREDPRDVLVTSTRAGLASLPHGALVGTSSPRRAAFLRSARPDVVVAEIRGNVETRLRKVQAGEFDATILALAGLRRLGLPFADDEVLPTSVMLPAPGQGALAIQCRTDAHLLRGRLGALDDRATRVGVTAERALLRSLGASCELAL